MKTPFDIIDAGAFKDALRAIYPALDFPSMDVARVVSLSVLVQEALQRKGASILTGLEHTWGINAPPPGPAATSEAPEPSGDAADCKLGESLWTTLSKRDGAETVPPPSKRLSTLPKTAVSIHTTANTA